MAEYKYTLGEIRERLTSDEAVQCGAAGLNPVDADIHYYGGDPEGSAVELARSVLSAVLTAAFPDNSEEASREEPGEEWPSFVVQRFEQDDPIRPHKYVVLDGTQSTDFTNCACYVPAATHPATLSDEDRETGREIARLLDLEGHPDAAAYVRQLADCSTQPEQKPGKSERTKALDEVRSLAPHEVTCHCEEGGNFDLDQHAEDCPRRQVAHVLAELERRQPEQGGEL